MLSSSVDFVYWCRGGLYGYLVFFFFQAEDGIRDLVRSRGLGDVYKRQVENLVGQATKEEHASQRDDEARDTHVGDPEALELSLIHI